MPEVRRLRASRKMASDVRGMTVNVARSASGTGGRAFMRVSAAMTRAAWQVQMNRKRPCGPTASITKDDAAGPIVAATPNVNSRPADSTAYCPGLAKSFAWAHARE